jgi:outer membrane protein OmpU
MATSMTFTGNGELDNGSTVKLTIAHKNKGAYSTSAIGLTTPTLGTFTYDEGGGTGLDRIDDMMPTAWEETDGTALPVGLRTVAGAGGSADIEWNVGIGLPDGMNVYGSFAPRPGGGQTNTNKAVGGDSGAVDGHGWDIVLTHNAIVDGLNVFAGLSQIDQVDGMGDRDQHAYGATYAIGGATIGYQYSKDENPGVTAEYYENDAYGVSYSINDDLTVSYGLHSSKRNTTGVEIDSQSLQISYSVGGASIKLAENDVDNQNYVSGTNKEGRTIALSLAF